MLPSFPNPTTAMNMVIKSLDLKPGDEVLSSNHEYGAVEKTWKFVANKKGFSYKSIDIPIPFKEDEFINRIKKEKKHRETITKYQESVYFDQMDSASNGQVYTENPVDDDQ